MATPAPATPEEFLAYLDKDANLAEEDELADFLEAGTEAAEGWRNVGPIVVREFTDRVTADCGRLFLPRTPVQSVATVTNILDGTVFVTADLDVDGVTGIVRSKTGHIPRGDYDVVYDAGRDPVPVSLKTAVLIIAGHLWMTQQGPTTNRFIGSQDAEDTFRPSAGYLIPNRAAHLLQPHMSVLVA